MPAIRPPGAIALTWVCANPGTKISFVVPFLYMYPRAAPCPTITLELLIPNSSVDNGPTGALPTGRFCK
jgi:hypothetical protein